MSHAATALPSPWARAAGWLAARLGIDAGVGYNTILRAWSAASGLVTLWVVASQLDRTQQGYFYTFSSLLAVQVFAELGINFVVMQFASHEVVALRFVDGELHGDSRSLSRLAGMLRFALLWFSVLGILFVLIVVPTGIRFISRDLSADVVRWRGAWAVSVVLTGLLLPVAPFFSLIEGCGRVADAARARLLQAVSGAVVLWIAFEFHAGLAALPLSLLATLLAGVAWLLLRERPMLRSLQRAQSADRPTALLREVFPLQWRIALSWLAGYFVAQIFAPVLFRTRGPVEAGQMGMSMSLASGVTSIALVWITTKSPAFGSLVARRRFDDLDALFRRALRHAILVALAGATALAAVLMLVRYEWPRFTERLLPALPLAGLVIGALASVIMTAEAAYLRAFKRELFLPISLAVGLATAVTTTMLSPHFGAAGVAFGYCAINWLIGVGSGTLLFLRSRRNLQREFGS